MQGHCCDSKQANAGEQHPVRQSASGPKETKGMDGPEPGSQGACLSGAHKEALTWMPRATLKQMWQATTVI